MVNVTSYIQDGDVKVGCQTIKRFELEQFALAQDWDFPTPK